MNRVLNKLETIKTLCDEVIDILQHGGSTKEVAQGFDMFWAAYPKKECLVEAESAWKSVVTQKDVPLILANLKRRKWPEEKRFIPAPHRWLRNKRWLEAVGGMSNGKYEGLGETV